MSDRNTFRTLDVANFRDERQETYSEMTYPPCLLLVVARDRKACELQAVLRTEPQPMTGNFLPAAQKMERSKRHTQGRPRASEVFSSLP
jgi:hypothetical protein